MNKTATSVLAGKHLHKKNPFCAALETYDKTPIFIPLNIKEDAAESVAQKRSGSSGPGGVDSEALHGWISKFGGNRKILRTCVENFVNWIANNSPPWAAYCAFMSGRLSLLEKQPGVFLVRVGVNWRLLFAKIVLKVPGL